MRKLNVAFAIVLTLLFLQWNSTAYAQTPSDIIISEYVEGSSNNKAIELYNATGASIDLTAGNYILQYYFNGSTSVGTTITLTGTIANNSVYLVAQSSASFLTTNGGSITANLANSSSWYNGDDAIILRKGGASGTIIDIIGQLGFDPGTEWGTGLASTADNTLRRKSSICSGDITSGDTFDPAAQWDGFAIDDFSGLGSHTSSCAVTSGITLSPNSLNFTTPLGVVSAEQFYTVKGTSLTNDITVAAPADYQVALISGGSYNSSVTITAAAANAAAVPVYVVFNPAAAGTLNKSIIHTSGTSNGSLSVQGTGISEVVIPVYTIQGSGISSAYDGTIVTTEGVVTADFQNNGQLGGFYIQDLNSDGNSNTSDGIFVYNTSFSVNPGDIVKVTGEVDEYFEMTEIKNVSAVSIISSGNMLPTPTSISLPVTALSDLERYEGMLVKFSQTLTVTETFTLGRYGELGLSVDGRVFNPTNFIDLNDDPASGTSTTGTSNLAKVNAQQDLNNRRRILLDDGSTVQNPAIVPYLNPVDNTLRSGTTVTDLTGVLDFAFGEYRIQPVLAPAFNFAPRPTVPSVGTYNIKTASFNVLNYFNGDGLGEGFPTPRGAHTAVEFTRQRTKIINAISSIDADVIGLIEMENDGDGPNSAIADIVQGLNDAAGAGTYAYVADPAGPNGNTGTDAIKVAIVYKPAVVTPAGLPVSDMNPVHNRPPLAQTFTLNSNGEQFNFIVVHFKSKSCTDATGQNIDQLDGQGCYNANRKLQATALLSFINAVQTTSGDLDVISVGDYNAYGQEDPMDILRAGGLNDILEGTYSYVFDGQSGSLDHALITSSLTGYISGADKWHINADEPVAKDYNQEFNPAYLYTPDAYRSSDHDPVLIGLVLQAPQTVPYVSNFTKPGNEDEAIAFTTADFTAAYNDLNNDQLNKIQLTQLPENGQLKLNNIDVELNQEINADDIENLLYQPNADFFGTDVIGWNGADAFSYAANPASIEISVASANDAPSISITNPANGTSFQAGNNITISAESADIDGTINKVEFYEGTAKIGEALSAPFEISYSFTIAGNYTLTAKAFDDSAASTVSDEVHVTTTCENTTGTTSVAVCSNQLPYNWNGIDYYTADTYTYTTINAAGCDSVATLILTVAETTTSTTSATVCSVQLPYNWNGVDYYTADTYTYTTTNTAGCDSVATLILTVAETNTSTTSATVCSDQLPYNWNGVDYYTADTYTYTTTNAAGCDSVAILVLNVNQSPVAGSVAGMINCRGGTTTVIVSASGGTLPYTSGTGEFTVNAGNYFYTVTDFNGCTSTTDITVADGTGTAPARPSGISGKFYNLCGGGNFYFSTQAVAGATSYAWTVTGTGLTVTGTTNSAIVHIPANFSGTAQLSVKANNDCGISTARTITLYAVSPNPSGAINGPSTVSANQNGIFYALPNEAGLSFNWVVNGGTLLQGQGTNKIKVNWGSNNGNVRVRVHNACGFSPWGQINVTVLPQPAFAGQSSKAAIVPVPVIKAYPNPAKNVTTLSFSASKAAEKYTILVKDLNGKAVIRKSGNTIEGINQVQLDITSLASGMYNIQVVRNNISESVKLFKQ